ncbi:MAG TPA: sulfatase-like hydrolase/transferase [Sedimentisphaerales bacterium]|nr:sulfatase-like hydrolase/transferase [Sedimentisphaerales bacterium]
MMVEGSYSRRDFLKATGLGAAAVVLSGCAGQVGRARRPAVDRPNILILMTDQQRWDALSCYGCEAVKTPNLDRLAAEGALFEACYSPCPVCTPSRASMWTGKPLPGHGVYKLHDILPDDQVLFSKRLQRRGYETSLVGKLHVSGIWHEAETRHPNDGFEHYHWCVDPGLNFDSKFNSFARWVKKKDPAFYERLTKEGKSLRHFPAELHFTRWAGETTIDLIENRDKDRPFFIMMSLFDPHDPYFDHPLESRDLVNDEKIPEPQPIPQDKDRPEGVRREMEKAASIKEKSETFKESIHELRKGYYASIAFLDEEMGKVLKFLDKEGLTEKTLVIFVSDHGDMLWDRGLFTKGAFFYDASVRVPLLMRLPGRIPAGTRVKEPVQLLDIAATVLARAGFSTKQLKETMPDSMDLVSLIQQGRDYDNYRDYAVCMYRNTGYGPGQKYFDPPIHATMFRDEGFKLNVYHGSPDGSGVEGELYDMQNDPQETNNLWSDPRYTEVKTRLMGRLVDWMFEHDLRYLGSRGGEKFFTLKKDYYGGEK